MSHPYPVKTSSEANMREVLPFEKLGICALFSLSAQSRNKLGYKVAMATRIPGDSSSPQTFLGSGLF